MSDVGHADAHGGHTVYRRRLFVNRFNIVMSLGTMALGMVFLLWILAVLFCEGICRARRRRCSRR